MAFADLVLDEDVLEAGESEAVICCMRTSTWKEVLNVEVSICLFILEKNEKREKSRIGEAGDPQSQLLRIYLSAVIFSHWSRQFERK